MIIVGKIVPDNEIMPLLWCFIAIYHCRKLHCSVQVWENPRYWLRGREEGVGLSFLQCIIIYTLIVHFMCGKHDLRLQGNKVTGLRVCNIIYYKNEYLLNCFINMTPEIWKKYSYSEAQRIINFAGKSEEKYSRGYVLCLQSSLQWWDLSDWTSTEKDYIMTVKKFGFSAEIICKLFRNNQRGSSSQMCILKRSFGKQSQVNLRVSRWEVTAVNMMSSPKRKVRTREGRVENGCERVN